MVTTLDLPDTLVATLRRRAEETQRGVDELAAECLAAGLVLAEPRAPLPTLAAAGIGTPIPALPPDEYAKIKYADAAQDEEACG